MIIRSRKQGTTARGGIIHANSAPSQIAHIHGLNYQLKALGYDQRTYWIEFTEAEAEDLYTDLRRLVRHARAGGR
jgi:hypothetical protein